MVVIPYTFLEKMCTTLIHAMCIAVDARVIIDAIIAVDARVNSKHPKQT